VRIEAVHGSAFHWRVRVGFELLDAQLLDLQFQLLCHSTPWCNRLDVEADSPGPDKSPGCLMQPNTTHFESKDDVVWNPASEPLWGNRIARLAVADQLASSRRAVEAVTRRAAGF
jgi:hypothetical protein